MKSYIPISCDFYDELEALATLKKICSIIFYDHAREPRELNGIIKTFFIREKTEYMILESGEEISLDQLISVDGKTSSP